MGIIGTGSSGVQAVPVVAEQAAHLHLFQRSAAYALPSSPRPYEPGELEALKADYPAIRAAQQASFIGAARLSAFSALVEARTRPPIKSATEEEKAVAVAEHGIVGALMWGDVLVDLEANRMATELYGRAVAQIVTDPETAAALVPDYPFACKRPIIGNGYYETFNRDDVTLVDLRRDPIRTVTPTGVDTEQRSIDLDVLICATGFDAITGSLTRMAITGRGGVRLDEVWRDQGPASYLGLQVAGFPNLFTIQAPGSPSAATNLIVPIEHNVGWIGDCLEHLDGRTIEATAEAQQRWADNAAAFAEGSLLLDPSCTSWYVGSNVPGKKRVYLGYLPGLVDYRRRCDRAAAEGYAGFTIT